MPYKLVTFDVTNTLLKFRTSPGQQYAHVAGRYGIKAEPEKLTAAFKMVWRDLNATHPNFGMHSTIKNSSEWWKTIVSRTFLSAGYSLDNSQLTSVAGHLIQIYNTSACWDTRPGARELLTSLKGNSELALGVISNFDERLFTVLKNTGLLNFFDFILSSYNARCYKPQPEIFHQALQHAKCGVREAVHIGDDVKLDYYAARNAGWDAVLLLPDSKSQPFKLSEELDYVDQNHVIDNLEAIRLYVEK